MKRYWSRNGRIFVLGVILLSCTILFSPIIPHTSLSPVHAAAPCTGGGNITGTVFRDYDANGADAGALEPGVSNIIVTAYDSSNTDVASCETNANGAYDLNIAVFPVRLEISNIPTYLQSGPAGADSETTVTFVSGPASGVDFGLANPAQYCEAATDQLATTCFVNGSAENSPGGPNDTLVRWDYIERGDTTPPTHISERDHIGSAWGLAYDPLNQDLYTAAFLKRHVGLKNGLGAIFLTDPMTTTVNGSLFVDVTAPPFNLDVGEIGTDAVRGLVADPSARSNDPAAFYMVGKVGLGDLTIDENNQALWFINLFEQTLHSLEMDSLALQTFSIPTNQCSSYTTIKLNAGGADFATLVGSDWEGDGYHVGGTTGTTNALSAPYNTDRTDSSFEYMVPLPDGDYDVTLYVYKNNPPTITFDATIEGSTQTISVSGNTPYSETRSITVNDGLMNFTFDNPAPGSTPTINGIEITAATSGQQFNDTAAFALKAHDGAMYIGLTCTAEYSQDSADLDAYVFRLDGGTFTQVATFDLDYTKGWASDSGSCEDNGTSDWHPWATSLPDGCANSEERTVWPQPILSGIEFDIDDSLILTFMDRLGHQLGNLNWELTGTSDRREGVIGGDILRVHNDDGTYQLENNGTASTTAAWQTPDNGVGNGEGPGGGEFYQDDVSPPRSHREISVGGIAHIYGIGEVVGTVMDPIGDPEAGGVMFFNNITGSSTTDPFDEQSFNGYEVYESSGSVATFGKANGIGDLVLLCTAAPISLGNRVWIDTDLDGVQDANEIGFDNVTVGLYDVNGTLLASMVTITDPQGNPGFYQFIGDGMDGATWVNANDAVLPNTDYTIAIFDSEFSGGDLDGYNMTINDQNPDALATPDIRDSDGVGVTVGAGLNAATRGISLTTGAPGANNHTYDFGVVQVDADWGDAPDGIFGSYPTLLGTGSTAYHLLIPTNNPFMGACVDSEVNGQPDGMATGDDIGPPGTTTLGTCVGNDDEDGIVGLGTPLVPGEPMFPITVDMTASPAACLLNAWIDFNDDGDWDDPDDQIFADQNLGMGTVHNLTFAVPGSAVGGITTSARFRCSTSSGLTPTNAAPDGEVEDYQVNLALARDFGDLPDTYGTIDCTVNAACHIINDIRLGVIVDAELAGSPDVAAMGDDGTFSDDEDGIVFTASGGTWGDGTGDVNVTVSGGNGCLIGWIDFDGMTGFSNNVPDGIGTVPEHIFTEFLGPGTTSLSFSTPASTTGGGTFVYPPVLHMRFRLFPPNDPLFASLPQQPNDVNGCPNAANDTTAMAAISVGEASNGEVEDYVQGFGPTAVGLQSLSLSPSPKVLVIVLALFVVLVGLSWVVLLRLRRD